MAVDSCSKANVCLRCKKRVMLHPEPQESPGLRQQRRRIDGLSVSRPHPVGSISHRHQETFWLLRRLSEPTILGCSLKFA